MDTSIKILREYLKKSNMTDDGFCFKKTKTGDKDYTIGVDKNGKIMVFYDNEDKKYRLSFLSNEEDFHYYFGIKDVKIYGWGFNKNMVSRNADFAETFVFDEDSLWQLDDFWIGKRRTLEEVSFYVIQGILLVFEDIIKDIQLELSDFGFTNF